MESDFSTASTAHYAIIEAVRSDAAPERFVISYRNELSLRQVIAGSCIVATGFLSRLEALEGCGLSLTSVA